MAWSEPAPSVTTIPLEINSDNSAALARLEAASDTLAQLVVFAVFLRPNPWGRQQPDETVTRVCGERSARAKAARRSRDACVRRTSAGPSRRPQSDPVGKCPWRVPPGRAP